MSQAKEELAKKAFSLAEKYEKTCTGCAQTTIAGIFDALSIKNDDVFKSASGLADGLGLSGDGSCGALVGASMTLGYLFGRERQDFADMMKPMKSYLLVKKLHGQFVEKYGTCRCCDLQTSLMGRTFNLLDPKELDEAMKFGMLDHCSQVAGTAAKMATEIILEAQEEEQG
ncbi:MAG: C_GCAxxG_C_C family protein [Deltaproteobacteria bacterium]|nr:C_GCAxxG_C_C family protein [Deltaproteobacteria bacterium]MBW2053239.1 C_GCAxxG_C_C family protein [Deltaproteobacteria bacterium]MBW2141796.1 C_GCAxxG_C_C family protein [Deltaproteobacteria bacterium]MBW2324688.1 C_GCAxxG_C_C family protein [Deltaproteobacteria bacterium]